MDKIKVLVSGCNGKMGQIVCQLISESNDMEVVAGFDITMREFSAFPVFETISDLYDDYLENKNANDIDVIIDFSSPECTISILDIFASHFKIPMVIATTGFSDEQLNKIKEYSSNVPIFMSSNMSYKINVINKTLQLIAPLLSDCDIEISEIHHNRKNDAPSGTAKMLAETINSSLNNNKETIYGREGKRKPEEIGISALRGGDVVGTHTVYFLSPYEEIEITHRASSRALFAEGAIKAAQLLAILHEDSGIFSMDDLI